MIRYFSLRFSIYNHALKLWLENLKQTGMAVVALFQFALPALILMPLLSIAIIVKPETAANSFFHTLWGYLLVLYTWVNCQKAGILAEAYQHYLATLPVNKWLRRCSDISVAVYVANLLILVPAFLFLYALTNISADDPQLVQAVTTITSLLLLACYYCYAAVKLKTPWLSLFALPVTLSLLAPDFNKINYVACWSVAILVEHSGLLSFKFKGPKPQKLFSLFIRWETMHPQNNKLVLVVALVLLLISKVVLAEVSSEFAYYFLNFIAGFYGIVLATNLFSLQKLKSSFALYFTTLPLSSVRLQWSIINYSLLKVMGFSTILLISNLFSLAQWLLLLSFYITSLIGIVKQPNKFIIFPVGLTVVLVLMSVVS